MKSEKEKMLIGELYLASDNELLKERRHAKRLLRQINISEYLVTKPAKDAIKELIPNTGKNFYIEPPFHCDYGYNIHCGDNVYFNVNCVVLDTMKINIGSNVLFGPAVQIYAASHPLDAETRKTLEFSKPISIGNDCWIGGGAIILPGVSIGNNCVIGAGSVVTRDVPDNAIAVGNPAKVMRK
ncbi:MAG: sugar O-acetyltransferase [Bacteroidetes bacterium]|nr:sugar O-acetyltransferase [Bacteroidota bacterium]MBU1373736.1 sugar O-acetyltransferase [Bacteroidota bacterium]MBU1486110.1 sugar O-acetyltransferase [Bacteroidota bacterium]MBU1760612.1 sugar O-acetyltransferase [Bacteroidota bacterium]MBU2046693.1 sugar O-acetyltransferase [Bacteroidota bacterium]